MHPLAKEKMRRASTYSVGIDCVACIEEPILIPPNTIKKIPLGIALDSPGKNKCWYLMGRSSLPKRGLIFAIGVGVIDPDYRGEIFTVLYNYEEFGIYVNPGERLCQLLLIPTYLFVLEEVKELTETARGEKGYGHSGK